MRARRAVALGVVAWVVVAVAGATLVWGVISRAGQGVSGELAAVPSAGGSGAAGPVGRRTVSASPSSAPSLSPSTPPPETQAADPSRVSPSTTTTPAPETSSGTVAAPVSVTRSWQGRAGQVSASCRGSAVRHGGSWPSSGFRVEVDDTGPDRVRVEFENDESRTRVEATCVDGVPEFTVDTDD